MDTAVDATVDVAAAAGELIAGLVDEPWGQVSPSVYETGRVVTLTPWLTGHARRVKFLVTSQRPDGGWGAPPPGYALVPTLSATEAILATLRRGPAGAGVAADHGISRADLAACAERGLGALTRWLGRGADISPGAPSAGRPDAPPRALVKDDLPDLPAIELIVPALIALIDEHLAAAPEGVGRGIGPLRPPAGIDGTMLEVVRSRLAAGVEVPKKLLHALETVPDVAAGSPAVRTEPTGTVGAAPAPSAALLGARDPGPADPTRRYLERATRLHDGPVPCGYPITVFERSWVVSWLVRAGISITVPEEVVASIEAGLGPGGTAAAAGLPADADTTSGAVYALSLLGRPPGPEALRAFELDSHFCTWRGEDGESVSTNAHVLEAFGQHLAGLRDGGRGAGDGLAAGPASGHRPDPGSAIPGYAATVDKLSAWLRDRQAGDGSWRDRWHASPYYATACCAIALDAFGGADSVPAVRRARRWVLDTQRPDGSWGVWDGSAEETAYAVQVLRLTRPAPGERDDAATERARSILLRAPQGMTEIPMWHDKDLYLPTAIVRAAVLSALHLTRPGALFTPVSR